MKTFTKFLFEMNSGDALKILGLSSNFTEDDLKKAYRRASSQNHPDRGGSTELMQQINVAYDFLKKNIGQFSADEILASRMAEWRDLAKIIVDDLKHNLSIFAYQRYFERVFGESFTSTVKRLYPDDAELKRLENMRRPSAPHYVYYDIEWANEKRTRVFSMTISVSIVDLYKAAGLASPGTSYRMGIGTFAYIDGRKVKITQRDYVQSALKSVFTNPETVFPKNKILKKNKTKFKKSDMFSALKAELRAKQLSDPNHFLLPLGKDRFLSIFRTTIMRQASWSIGGVWKQKGKFTWGSDDSYPRVFASFPETEETLEMFRKLKDMEPNKAVKFVEKEYLELKNKLEK